LLLSRERVGRYLVQPSHPSLRLWQDSRDAVLSASVSAAPPVEYTPKLRLLADGKLPFCPSPRHLLKVYVLGTSTTDEIRIEKLRPRDAVIEMTRNTFLLEVSEHSMLRHHYTQLLDVAECLPFYRVEYPRQFNRLGDVRRTIGDHVRHAQAA
jgi:hypothetical protein